MTTPRLTNIQTLLERVLESAGCPNVNDEPPPPLTTWEGIHEYLTYQSGGNLLTEVWFVDRPDLRTDNSSYRTAPGSYYNRQSWEIMGLLERDSWEDSYYGMADRLQAVSAYLQYFIDLASTLINIVAEWSFTIRWHQFGERWVFSGAMQLDIILIES